MPVLGLHCWRQAFSAYSKRGLLLLWCTGFSWRWLLLLWSTGSGCTGFSSCCICSCSVVVTCGFSCSMACGIFQDQGWNPGPIHWQADFHLLRHQEHSQWAFFRAYSCKLPHCAAAAAKSLQLCPTLCNPIDGSPPGSPIPGILQAQIGTKVFNA